MSVTVIDNQDLPHTHTIGLTETQCFPIFAKHLTFYKVNMWTCTHTNAVLKIKCVRMGHIGDVRFR